MKTRILIAAALTAALLTAALPASALFLDQEETSPTVLDVVKIPFVAENDQTAIRLGVRTCNEIDRERPRIVRIEDTMHLEEIEISEALLGEAQAEPDIEIVEGPYPWAIDEKGN